MKTPFATKMFWPLFRQRHSAAELLLERRALQVTLFRCAFVCFWDSLVVVARVFLESAWGILSCLYLNDCILCKYYSMDVAYIWYAKELLWFGMRSMPSKQSSGSRSLYAVSRVFITTNLVKLALTVCILGSRRIWVAKLCFSCDKVTNGGIRRFGWYAIFASHTEGGREEKQNQ